MSKHEKICTGGCTQWIVHSWEFCPHCGAKLKCLTEEKRLEKQIEALKMRLSGKTYIEIGEALERNPSTIYGWMFDTARKAYNDKQHKQLRKLLIKNGSKYLSTTYDIISGAVNTVNK
jgi:hypothetical protein